MRLALICAICALAQGDSPTCVACGEASWVEPQPDASADDEPTLEQWIDRGYPAELFERFKVSQRAARAVERAGGTDDEIDMAARKALDAFDASAPAPDDTTPPPTEPATQVAPAPPAPVESEPNGDAGHMVAGESAPVVPSSSPSVAPRGDDPDLAVAVPDLSVAIAVAVAAASPLEPAIVGDEKPTAIDSTNGGTTELAAPLEIGAEGVTVSAQDVPPIQADETDTKTNKSATKPKRSK